MNKLRLFTYVIIGILVLLQGFTIAHTSITLLQERTLSLYYNLSPGLHQLPTGHFGGSNAKLETFDSDYIKALNEAKAALFSFPTLWQEKLGICLFDQNSIESGRQIEGSAGSNKIALYTIFIEDKNNIVYVLNSA